jgi:hypothetical protein
MRDIHRRPRQSSGSGPAESVTSSFAIRRAMLFILVELWHMVARYFRPRPVLPIARPDARHSESR